MGIFVNNQLFVIEIFYKELFINDIPVSIKILEKYEALIKDNSFLPLNEFSGFPSSYSHSFECLFTRAIEKSVFSICESISSENAGEMQQQNIAIFLIILAFYGNQNYTPV